MPPLSTPFLFSASLSPKPVSHSSVPLGWRIRKQGAATPPLWPSYSPVSEKGAMSWNSAWPQSSVYRWISFVSSVGCENVAAVATNAKNERLAKRVESLSVIRTRSQLEPRNMHRTGYSFQDRIVIIRRQEPRILVRQQSSRSHHA